MKFSTYLKKIERKRSLTKKIVIYGIYALTPLVLFVSAFSNDRIITKCEEIKRNCAEQAAPANTTEQDEEIELLREENRVLRSAAQGSSNELAEDLNQANRRAAKLTKENKELNVRIQELTPAPGARSIDDYIRENRDLNQQITDLNNNQGNEESVYRRRYFAAKDTIKKLEYDLRVARTTIRNSVSQSDFDAAQAEINKLKQDVIKLKQDNKNLQSNDNQSNLDERIKELEKYKDLYDRLRPGNNSPVVDESFRKDNTTIPGTLSGSLNDRAHFRPGAETVAGRKGKVTVKICVDSNGVVSSVKHDVATSPIALSKSQLIESAKRSAESWKFLATNSSNIECGIITYQF